MQRWLFIASTRFVNAEALPWLLECFQLSALNYNLQELHVLSEVFTASIRSSRMTMFTLNVYFYCAWASEGGSRGDLCPPDFKNFSKKGCFFNFEGWQPNFTTLAPPLDKILEKYPSGPPGKNLSDAHATVSFFHHSGRKAPHVSVPFMASRDICFGLSFALLTMPRWIARCKYVHHLLNFNIRDMIAVWLMRWLK